jgi:hypothetical protein
MKTNFISKLLSSMRSKLVIDNFFCLRSFKGQKVYFKFVDLKIIFYIFSNHIGWRHTIYQNYNTQRDLKLYSWKPFNLKSFWSQNIQRNNHMKLKPNNSILYLVTSECVTKIIFWKPFMTSLRNLTKQGLFTVQSMYKHSVIFL